MAYRLLSSNQDTVPVTNACRRSRDNGELVLEDGHTCPPFAKPKTVLMQHLCLLQSKLVVITDSEREISIWWIIHLAGQTYDCDHGFDSRTITYSGGVSKQW